MELCEWLDESLRMELLDAIRVLLLSAPNLYLEKYSTLAFIPRLSKCLPFCERDVDVERRIPVVDSEEEMDLLSEKLGDRNIIWSEKTITCRLYVQEREDKVTSEVDGVPTYPPFLNTSASARNNTKESLCSEHCESSARIKRRQEQESHYKQKRAEELSAGQDTLNNYLLKLYGDKILQKEPNVWFSMKDVLQMVVPLDIREDLERWMALSRADRKKERTRKARGGTKIKSKREMFFKGLERQFEIIYLLGEAGVGKSTFCHRLIDNWCKVQDTKSNDDYLRELKSFPFLFFIQARHAKTSQSVYEMIQTLNCPLKFRSILKEVFTSHPKNCLVLIHGFDEWQSGTRGYQELPNVTEIEGSTILITSRQWRIEALDCDLPSSCRVLEIQGLDSYGIENLAGKALEAFTREDHQCSDCESLVKPFLDQMYALKLDILAKIPLILLIFIRSWFDGNRKSKDSKIDLSTDCAWQACDVAKQDFDDDVEKTSDNVESFIGLDNRESASDVAKQEFDEDKVTMSDEVLPEGQSSKSMSQSEGQLETVTITDMLPADDIPYNDLLRKVSVETYLECFFLPPIFMVREILRRFRRQYRSLDLFDAVLLPPKLHHLSSIFGSAEFHRSLSMARLFLEPLVEKEVATGIIMKELKFYTPKQTGEQYKLEKHSQKYLKRIEKTSLKPKLFSDLVMMESYEHLLSPSFENDVTHPLYVPAKMLLGSERIQCPLSPSIDTQENEGYTYHLKLMENEDLSEDTETVDDLITGHSICLRDNEQESRLMPRTEIGNVEELDRKVALNRRTMATDGLKPHVSHIRDNTWIPLEDLPKPTLDHVIVAPNPDSRIDMTLEEIFESIGQRLVPGPKTTMRYEFLRLCTMKTFPSINKPFIIRLVATGFYYASVSDELTCYCCGIRNSNWRATDNPEGIHRNRSPRCKFFLRNQEVNVRIPEPSGPQSDNLQRLEHLQQISSNPERATTSLPATEPERQLPTTEGTGHIAGDRAVRSPGAAGLQSDETVPTTTVQAKYPHYATKSARLESFKGWPQSLTQTPDIMAEAGFYFAGFGDCCRCFQCGVGLRHWDIDDNPWVEHCRWSSSCLYLKLKKGEEFVRLVQMAVTVTQEAPETLINRQLNGRSTLEEDRSESGTPAPPQLSEVNTLLLTDAAQSVLEMGYQPKIIKQAIGKILQTKGRTGITAVALMEEVMELEEKEKQENATQNNSNNTVVLKSGGSTDQEEITLLVSDFSANTEGETNATASTDDSTLDSKAIKSENERLREQTLCKICLVNSICVVFLPCGHLVTCVDCAPAMRKCPMCRQIVKGTVRTYMG